MSATGYLVFARCVGFVLRAPGFSHPSVPRIARAGLALALTLAIVPSLAAVARDGMLLVIALVVEFALGSAMGLAASLLYDGAYAGGRLIDDYVGVKAIAPNIDLVAPSGFGRVWSMAFTGGFFVLGAYAPALSQFRASFDRIPPGGIPDVHAWLPFIVSFAASIAGVALAVAGPALGLAFVSQIALAAIARAVPRFSTFTLSFAIVFAVVLAMTAIGVALTFARAAHPLPLMPRFQ
ncbi:MAG TPA: flagellar biosynthetic protein FliR [Candidatus Aquilonibacter sp.]|nr:flagellar biosynthetic protein FliR [Candidatus Aquilonibacter sp.]